MTSKVTNMNPEILVWARERAGWEAEEVANKIGRSPETILAWESGESAPTYIQLEKLAYKVYKRPIAIFFFQEPPDEPAPSQSFRTLPEFELEEMGPDTLYATRQAQAMQISLSELNDGVNPSQSPIFVELEATANSDLTRLAAEVREYLEISLVDQKKFRNIDIALKTWRDAIQECGVFVFKRSIKQKSVSGFCFWDKNFPIIYLNNSTAKSRQIFTLLHELAHILLQTSGVTKSDDSYIRSLEGEARAIEVFCNKFAAEFLVPASDFESCLQNATFDEEFFQNIASQYKVSRQVILRKVLDRRLVSEDFYEQMSTRWKEEYREWEEQRRGTGRGDYYATQASYLGQKYLDLVFTKYHQGKLSVGQLAEFLNVKVSKVARLEDFALRDTANT